MSRQYTFLSILMLSLAVSCSKAQQEFILEAGMPETETKTVLGPKSGAKYPVLWSVEDRIVVNGVESKPLTAIGAGSKTAVFRFDQAPAAPFNVLYGGIAGSDDAFEIPARQQYYDGNLRSGYAPMYASSTESSFTMNHLACILALQLKSSVPIKGISVSSLDGTPLAGHFRLEKEGGLLTGKTTTVSGNAHIDLTISSEADISEGKTFYIAICPGTHGKGIRLDIYAKDGSRMALFTLAGETLSAGQVYELPTGDFVSNIEPVTCISSYDDLKDFAKRVAAKKEILHARLLSDITVDDSWMPLEGFTGDFDGGGYTISGLKKAFANELLGYVRNLTLEGDINITGAAGIVGDESIFWAGILANRMYGNAIVRNCTTRGTLRYTQWGKQIRVGGIVGYAPHALIEDCVNEADIMVIGDGSDMVHAGGIIGRSYSSSYDVRIINCINKGDITMEGTVKSASLGGIGGHFTPIHTTSVFSGDINYGKITVPAATVLNGAVNIGGIVGYSLASIAGCTDEGSIHFSAPTESLLNIGGVAGNICASSIKECTGNTTMLVDSESTGDVRCGGIAGVATGDATIKDIVVDGCLYGGAMTLRIGTHGELIAKPIVGLYSTETHSETQCSSIGTITEE